MSTNLELESDEVCASCGMAGTDGMTLKKCACNLVKYCNVDCQKAHRPQHKKSCKMRLIEMRDESLLKQPDGSYLGECPLCCLPLPIDRRKLTFMPCCSKHICNGCHYANQKREFEQELEQRCAFCREPTPKSEEEADKNVMERVKKNDPVAMTSMGKKHDFNGDYRKALKYYTKAAELDDVDALYCLGTLYYDGNGVEKDMKKAIHHFEQAAIGGHPAARGLLAIHEMENGRFDRAANHLIIAANLGCFISLDMIKDSFVQGVFSEEDYAAALRGYQAAVNETKSAERETADFLVENGYVRRLS